MRAVSIKMIWPNDCDVDATATANVKTPLLALEKTWSISVDQTRVLRFNVDSATLPRTCQSLAGVTCKRASAAEVLACGLHLVVSRALPVQGNEVKHRRRQHCYGERHDHPRPESHVCLAHL